MSSERWSQCLLPSAIPKPSPGVCPSAHLHTGRAPRAPVLQCIYPPEFPGSCASVRESCGSQAVPAQSQLASRGVECHIWWPIWSQWDFGNDPCPGIADGNGGIEVILPKAEGEERLRSQQTRILGCVWCLGDAVRNLQSEGGWAFLS